MRGLQRLLVMLPFALVLAVAGGCGVPNEDKATTAGPDQVPFDLLEESPPEPPATIAPPTATVIRIYLLDPAVERLVGVDRSVQEGVEADLSDVVEVLLSGPTRQEAAMGLASAVPRGAVSDVALVGGVANVDLDQAFAELDGLTQRRAIAQLVYTLTSRPGVGRVAFTLSGQPVEIPRGDGTLTSGSVSRDGYRELAPSS